MAQFLKNAWQPFIAAGERAMGENRLEDAEANFHAALLEAELSDQSDERLAVTLDLLCELYQRTNQLELAEEYCLRNVRLKKDSSVFSSFDEMKAMLKLSKIYFVQSKLAQAAFSTKCVLELSERTLGMNHPAVAVVSQQLADLYTDLGSYAEAEYLYRRALSFQRNQYSANRCAPHLVQTLRGYANLLTRTHRAAEAQNLIECAASYLAA
ncbi:tetratricopeptide repeat protein [bacterium]|nr:tetratricopeptide repeat protein [bacterium]MBP9807949.1 tetratricopeptide repeat protein [bacterium]